MECIEDLHSSLLWLQHISDRIQVVYLKPIREHVETSRKGQLTLAYLARYSRLHQNVQSLKQLGSMITTLQKWHGNAVAEKSSSPDLNNCYIKLTKTLLQNVELQDQVWGPDSWTSQEEHDQCLKEGKQHQDSKHNNKIARNEQRSKMYNVCPEVIITDYELDMKICQLHDSLCKMMEVSQQMTDQLQSSNIKINKNQQNLQPPVTSRQFFELRQSMPQKILAMPLLGE